MVILLLSVALLALCTPAQPGASVYTTRLDDPRAVYVSAGSDGADETANIQHAIDRVQQAQGSGIVFLRSGTYRLTDTLQVWPGVRLIGYGPTRPKLVLAPNTPAFQHGERFMVFFAGYRPDDGRRLDLDHPHVDGLDLYFDGDANPGTFYSAMDNIDLEIGNGNPSAVGVRSRYAQHCYLAHIDFTLNSAPAGIHGGGNVAYDLRFFGGRCAIVTRMPSPGWPLTLLDCVFEGQTVAAIRTHETGLTLVRPTFRHVPTAVSVEPGHTEMLSMTDARLEDVAGPALEISREHSLRTQINVERTACRNVPTFAAFRESGSRIAGHGGSYVVERFLHGPTGDFSRDDNRIETRFVAKAVEELPAPPATDIRPLPDPAGWVNAISLGAKGDGEFDDTAILQAAIDKGLNLYLPEGKYRVTRTLRLGPRTALIGLHPFATQILIRDGTPAFAGPDDRTRGAARFPGAAVPLIETAKGGHNVVTGIGLDTGGNNPAATAARWTAAPDSLLNDVKFLGGHGSVPWNQIYNADHTADPNPQRHWDSEYPSLWVTDGGGGTFLNIWTASTFASAGIAVTDTATEGRVYELSSEHHVRNEVKLRNAAHWRFYGLQTEEERGEGPYALPIDVESCRDIQFSNLVMYRVIGMQQPYPCAIRVSNSTDFRIRNVHCNSNSKASFDSLVLEPGSGAEYRTREVADFTLERGAARAQPASRGVRKLAGGFANIGGGAVDAQGNLLFVDARYHRIYRWDAAAGELTTVADDPLWPVNLCLDLAGNAVVASYAGVGRVYAFQPGRSEIRVLGPIDCVAGVAKRFALPVSDFELSQDVTEGRTLRWPSCFLSPDGTTALPVDAGFLRGDLSWGVKSQAVLRSFGLAVAKPGDTFYMSGENDLRTYAATVGADGSLSGGRLFAEQGGEGVAVDGKGNVYLAAGQIYVYDSAGKPIREIRVPERPIQLVFGGPDGRTLFICARTSLYAVRAP